MILIDLTAMLIIGMSMAAYTSITALYDRLPIRGKITLIIVPAFILMVLMMINLPGEW